MWSNGRWIQRYETFEEWWYVKPGEYNLGETYPEEAYSHKLQDAEIHQLIQALDERLRDEETKQDISSLAYLKITHRLLDIIEDAGMNK